MCIKYNYVQPSECITQTYVGPMMPSDMIKQGALTSVSIWATWTAKLWLYSTFQINMTVKV